MTGPTLGSTLDGMIRRFLRREPKQSRSRALVAAVIQATDELLRGGTPIEQVTVERVSERAGIAMGSFYEYFGSKDSVMGVLIGHVTRLNFEELSRKLEALEHDSLDDLVRAFGRTVAETYLAHPNRTRVILETVGRLGLTSLVHEEKDRFAGVMAARAARFLPGESLDSITVTMRMVADANMGFMLFTAMRGGAVDIPAISEELGSIAIGLLHRRHGAAITS